VCPLGSTEKFVRQKRFIECLVGTVKSANVPSRNLMHRNHMNNSPSVVELNYIAKSKPSLLLKGIQISTISLKS
jgi:folate-dependent tRNA-U54 methylase TrmFO/GidA